MLSHQGRSDFLVKVGCKVLLPEPQGPGVMAADVLDLFHNQRTPGCGRDVVEQLSDGREVAAGKDVTVDEATTEYAVCLPSGMVMHWNMAIPPSRLSSLSTQAKAR
ncbi:hypothetical protein VTK26DRAFT_7591 [Humicola hyalothermophila]